MSRDVAAHDVGDLEARERRGLGRLLPDDPGRSQAPDVDRFLLEHPRRSDREDRDDHHRQEHGRVLRQLEDHDHRQKRRARHARRASPPIPRSAYPPTGAARCGRARCTSFATAPPRVAPTRSDGVNTPPTPPEPIVAAWRRSSRRRAASRKSERRVAVEDLVRRLEAVARRLRQARSRSRPRSLRRAPSSPRRGSLLAAKSCFAGERARTKSAEAGPAEEPDRRERQELDDRLRDGTARPGRPGSSPSTDADEHGRDDGRDDGGSEERHREGADDDLQDEQRRRDRRVVGAGHARRHAARRQDPHPLGRDLEQPGQRRRERGADLDDRTLRGPPIRPWRSRRSTRPRARATGRSRTVRRPSETTSIIWEMPLRSRRP